MKGNSLERGQGLVEFALVLVLVAVAVIIALTAVGDALKEVLCETSSAVGADTSEIVDCDYIDVVRTNYQRRRDRVVIVVKYMGDDYKEVTLHAFPGGPMDQRNKRKWRIVLEDQHCPCTYTVRASNGISTQIHIE